VAKAQSTIELIRHLLREGGKTRYQISKDKGIPQATLSRILDGSRGCGTDIADKLLDYFGYTITKKGRAK